MGTTVPDRPPPFVQLERRQVPLTVNSTEPQPNSQRPLGPPRQWWTRTGVKIRFPVSATLTPPPVGEDHRTHPSRVTSESRRFLRHGKTGGGGGGRDVGPSTGPEGSRGILGRPYRTSDDGPMTPPRRHDRPDFYRPPRARPCRPPSGQSLPGPPRPVVGLGPWAAVTAPTRVGQGPPARSAPGRLSDKKGDELIYTSPSRRAPPVNRSRRTNPTNRPIYS